MNGFFHAIMDSGRSSQIAATLLRQTGCQVACAGGSMHRFARGRQAKSLFGGLVGLHLGLGFGFGHDKTLSQNFQIGLLMGDHA